MDARRAREDGLARQVRAERWPAHDGGDVVAGAQLDAGVEEFRVEVEQPQVGLDALVDHVRGSRLADQLIGPRQQGAQVLVHDLRRPGHG